MIATREMLMLIESYLEQLNENQLDRVITAQDWCRTQTIDQHNNRCLVGHAEDYRRQYGVGRGNMAMDGSMFIEIGAVARAFDDISSLSLPYAVSYIKARAAEIAERKFPLRVPAPMPKAEPQMEEVGA